MPIVVVVFLGPALLPGKTLSSSDTLRFQPPWLSSKPAELERPSNVELGDSSQHLQQFLRTAADEFPDAPLWNPNIAGGRPFHANYQSSIFSPYSVPAYLLPFWTATTLVGVMKLWLAAFGTFLLARALGLRFGGALLAGVVFALNLKSVTWLIYPNLAVWALIPWLLLLTDRLVRRPDLLAGAGLAALVALQFLSGHPESSFHALLAAGAFFCLRLWQVRRREGASAAPAGRITLAFVAAVAGGTALAAVTLVPFLELLLGSADIRDRAGESIDVHLPFKDTLGIFMPDYWGRPTQSSTRPILLERAMYVGALPLMLAGRGADPQPHARAGLDRGVRRAVVRRGRGHPAGPADRDQAAAVQLGAQHAPDHPHHPRRCPARGLGPRRPDRWAAAAASAVARGDRRGRGAAAGAAGLRGRGPAGGGGRPSRGPRGGVPVLRLARGAQRARQAGACCSSRR